MVFNTRGFQLNRELVGCAGSSVTNFSQLQSAELARKNAGIAGPTSSQVLSTMVNAAMATVAKKSVIELSKQPTRSLSENEGRSEKVRF